MTAVRKVPAGWDAAAWEAFCLDVRRIGEEVRLTDPAVLTAALNEITAGLEPTIPPPLRAALVKVAKRHQAETVGYGETAFNLSSRTVIFVAGDWTVVDPIEADFLSIEGVDHFAYEHEALPDGWFDAEVVYPEHDVPAWVTSEKAAVDFEYMKALELARTPLKLPSHFVAALKQKQPRRMPYRIDAKERMVLTASGAPVPRGWELVQAYLLRHAAPRFGLHRAGKLAPPSRGFAAVDMRTRQVVDKRGHLVAGGAWDAVVARLAGRAPVQDVATRRIV